MFEDIINKEIIKCVISNNRNKKLDYKKITITPVIIKDEFMYQLEYQFDQKVEHENIKEDKLVNRLETFKKDFKQLVFFTKEADIQILISKKGKTRVIENKPTKKPKNNLSHNRKKNYILENDTKIDFLIELGVMSKDGKVKKSKYDKFKQINKYLEFIENTIDVMDKNKKINIIDFGCGKSYLTFALYYYLVNMLKLDVNIIGLDLKKDVIDFCNKTKSKLGYKNLKFIHGNIEKYEELDQVDMVITLHACNTATDAAIVKSVKWNAKVILSVPCCQHEVYTKIENKELEPMLKHGIIKEKLSSLVTDTLRGLFLEKKGYDVDIMEFINMQHTPKNILIKAVKNDSKNIDKIPYEAFKETFNLNNMFIDEFYKGEI